MRKKLHIEGLTLHELAEETKQLEKKYGASFEEFMKRSDDEEAEPNVGIDQMIWETLEEARRERIRSGRIELKISELTPAKVFTPKRMELLKNLADRGRIRIRELAEVTRRPYASIYNDVKLLEKLGFVEVDRVGRNIMVSTPLKEVVVTIA